ncbi:MAG: hypothetical protein V4645_30650 [Pseudomonadota bacterium]
MDTQKLKVFAERLRAYLERQNLLLKHGQALDLIAAIPGLRNWPEVNAFPGRVSAAQWDSDSADRLAKRIAKLHELILPIEELREALEPRSADVLKVWPNGPVPGLYVTTSQEAINAAIAKYEAATDGALLYAERAGQSADAAIDLGEYGLFSRGMDRLPSGTLVVLGPLPLTQESWSDNKDRLNVAADLAHSSSLRIAVLVETPLPENLHSDIDLLLRPDDEGLDSEPVNVLGVVTAAGDLQMLQPFVQRRLTPPAAQRFTTYQRLPQVLEFALGQALAKRPYGVIVLGITPGDTQRKVLFEAVLPLTEHAGPAVRIQPTFSPGYGKDSSPLSPHFQGLPIFPSIESAYASGYRRMVLESSNHAAAEAIARHAHEVCFLLRSWSTEVAGAWMSSLPDRMDKPNALDVVTAILCVADVPIKSGMLAVCDAYVGGASPAPVDNDIDRLAEHMQAHRAVRWEDELDALLAAKKVTSSQAKKALRRHGVEAHLASRTAQV